MAIRQIVKPVTLPVWHCSGALAESAFHVPEQRYDVKKKEPYRLSNYSAAGSPGPTRVVGRKNFQRR